MSAPVIHRLSQDTINRIAAGEVVQRPSAAIKELLENSLDAGATSIVIVAKGGGMQLLQIQDNGHGIRRDDLTIVCERFTTSKLLKFEDLESISTFGFRGEALASITYVSHVSILTKTTDSACAYKVKYLDGKCASDILPNAGNDGTIISVEDLFYNMPTRKQAFKNPAEEYQRILEVVGRYAIHNGDRNVSLTCKKHGQYQADLHTPSNSSVIENIRVIYGQTTSRELLRMDMSVRVSGGAVERSATSAPFEHEHGQLSFSASGYVSNANYSSKRATFILFINDRLVESASIKRAVDGVYADLLPRHAHPFAYLSLRMPAAHIDVNVHPTKKEVHFLFEADVLEYLQEGLRELLANANQSRTFYTQSLLPASGFVSVDVPMEDSAEENSEEVDSAGPERSGGSQDAPDAADPEAKRRRLAPRPAAPNKLVRTDASLRRIDSFFRPEHRSAPQAVPSPGVEAAPDVADVSALVSAPSPPSPSPAPECRNASSVPGAFAIRCECCRPEASAAAATRAAPVPSIVSLSSSSAPLWSARDMSFEETRCEYASVTGLIHEIHAARHAGFERLIRGHTLVGVADATYSLVQSGTKIVMLDHAALAYSLFRQLSIRRFGTCPVVRIEPDVDLLAYLRASYEAFVSSEDVEQRDDDARRRTELLVSKGPMLREYFSICVSEDGKLQGLPELLRGYRALDEELPHFLWNLSSIREWDSEQRCFGEVARVLGLYYSALPVEEEVAGALEQRVLGPRGDDIVKNVILPAVKQLLVVPNDLEDIGVITQLASLEQLYKIFERC